MNVNCVTNEVATGGQGRRRAEENHQHHLHSNNNSDGQQQYYERSHFRDHQQQQNKRPRSHSGGARGDEEPTTVANSVTSTMRSTTTIPEEHHHHQQHHNQLKATDGGGKGHYSSSSTMELYFAWFSAITFIGELVVDISLTTFYFQSGHSQWAIITLAIVLMPLVLCQIYSVVLMRSDTHYSKPQSVWSPILWHILLMGIPYRYLHLFQRVDVLPSHELRYKLQEIQAIQTINAILQYCPQCIFQVFIIMHRNFACLFTGISAGLAGFSFAWHLFLQCYSLAQRNHEDYKISAGPNFTSNLRVNNLENNSSSLATILTSTSSTSITMDDRSAAVVNYNPSAEEAAVLKKNLQILEKNSLMDNRNLVPKEGKNVDKVKIFQFNKRRPICQADGNADEFIHRIDQLDDSAEEVLQNKSTIYYEMTTEEDEDDDLQKPPRGLSTFESAVAVGDPHSMPRLKRKGICSSQEMLHLVDLMNENISADQIDKLEKSLLDLNGLELENSMDHAELHNHRPPPPQHHHNRLPMPNGTVITDEKSVAGSRGSDGDAESSNVFKGFPSSLDESTQSSILENIDAAIYENQIIFQERIRKNQLTIQNLKLQDQLLSQFMDLGANGLAANTNDLQTILMSLEEQRQRASLAASSHSFGKEDLAAGAGNAEPNTSMGYLSTRDYENMCFVNITRNVNKLKHWRNYVQNIQTSQHDTSSALNSSFFAGNTTSTTTDLAEAKVDDLYMVMQPIVNKNILVETINQINDSEASPLKQQQHQHQQGKQQERKLGPVGVEFDCGIGDDLNDGGGHNKMRKENGKAVPGLYFYNINNVPLDSILESNCEENI